MTACPGCGAVAGADHVSTERMFGLGGSFVYRECEHCATLRLLDPPADLAPFYPAAYYAHVASPNVPGPLTRWLRRRRAAAAFGGFDPVGAALNLVRPGPDWYDWLRRAGATRASSILEVGAGSGFRLVAMAVDGFTRVRGIDPFAPRDLDLPLGVRVLKMDLGGVQDGFDVVLLLHVLEHLPDPAAALRDLYRVVNPGGAVVLRTPVTGTHAWKTYGPDWVQLDPPRHLAVFSERGLTAAATAAGFARVDVAYDSEAFQFWGSELYRRGLTLTGADPAAVFGPEAMAGWAARAVELNAARDGDQVCAILRKAAS